MLKKIRCNFDVILEMLVVFLFLISLLPKNISNKEISNIINSKLNTNFSYNYENVLETEEEILQTEEKEEPVSDNILKETKKEEIPLLEIIEENVEEVIPEIEEEIPSYSVIETYYGTLTGYGPDCRGCSGITASGYDVKNTITYHDKDFGEVRIVAADKSIPFYSIIKISGIENNEPIYAIVLDTGGSVGFNKYTTFDLLFPSESAANREVGSIFDVKFELIRKGA